MRPRRFLSSFARDTNGVAAMVMSLVLTAIVGFTAMAVDFGSVFLQTRRLQGTADIAAMVAANDPSRAQAAAEAAVRDNIRSEVVTEAVAGTYQPAAGLAPESRFTATGVNPDAARVTLTTNAELYFAPIILGKDRIRITRTATAARPFSRASRSERGLRRSMAVSPTRFSRRSPEAASACR